MKKELELLSKINDFYINLPIEIKDNKLFYQCLQKNDFELLEWYILNNKYSMVQYSVELLIKNKNKEYLNIFLVGFCRNECLLKRMLPNYLLLQVDNKMKNLLLFFKDIRNISLKYNNENYVINLKKGKL